MLRNKMVVLRYFVFLLPMWLTSLFAGTSGISTLAFLEPAHTLLEQAAAADLSVAGVDLNQAVSEFRQVAYTTNTHGTLNGSGNVAKIANKDTILRVYPRLLSAATLSGVSGTVNGYACNTTTPLGPALTPINPGGSIIATNTPSAGQINSTLNFRLPLSWTTGCLDLAINLTAPPGTEDHNLLANNTLNWSGIFFSRVVPLNLVLAPYQFIPPSNPSRTFTADILFTPSGALQWLNNAYPLPGNFPQTNAGVNVLRILPMQVTSLQADAQGRGFLDQLQFQLSNLLSQGGLPGNVRLLGMVPCGCGGSAYLGGQVAFADTWAVENGPIMSSQFEGYGALWAHEIGHNFGREHASNAHGESSGGAVDPNFPYVHGGIGRYGLGINTEWWNSSPFPILPGTPPAGDEFSPHAHDFMSYGGNTAENTNEWVSDYTYNALFTPVPGFQQLARLDAPVEKVVIVGHINSDNSVAWLPFYRVTTDHVSSPGNSGAYSLELLDAHGAVLYTHRFDPLAGTHDEAENLAFAEFVPWQGGTAKIVLKHGEQPLAERAISAHTPTVTLLSPNGGETLEDQVTVHWLAADPDGGSLHFTIFYNSGTDTVWWPVVSDITGSSYTLDTTLLPGSSQGRFKIRVTDGVNSAEDESDGTFIVPQKSPLVGITHPLPGEHLHAGTDANLVAAVYDVEDGYLPDDNLVWSSDVDGELGHGHHVHHAELTPGTHTLTLTVTDSQGQTADFQVTVTVGYNLYLPSITR